MLICALATSTVHLTPSGCYALTQLLPMTFLHLHHLFEFACCLVLPFTTHWHVAHARALTHGLMPIPACSPLRTQI